MAGRSKISDGTDTDQVLVAIEALRAFIEDKEEVLAAQRSLYSDSFLEFGLLMLGSGMLLGSPDPGSAITTLAREVFNGKAQQYERRKLASVMAMYGGASIAIRTNRRTMKVDTHSRLLTLSLAMAGVRAQELAVDLLQVLDGMQLNLISAAEHDA